jgi:hypothetical protein
MKNIIKEILIEALHDSVNNNEYVPQPNNNKPTPFMVGEAYLIRTLSMTWHGVVTDIIGDFLVLRQAAWIADTGRFTQALEDANNFNEVEPAPNPVIVGIGAIVDATKLKIIQHSQK